MKGYEMYTKSTINVAVTARGNAEPTYPWGFHRASPENCTPRSCNSPRPFVHSDSPNRNHLCMQDCRLWIRRPNAHWTCVPKFCLPTSSVVLLFITTKEGSLSLVPADPIAAAWSNRWNLMSLIISYRCCGLLSLCINSMHHSAKSAPSHPCDNTAAKFCICERIECMRQVAPERVHDAPVAIPSSSRFV